MTQILEPTYTKNNRSWIRKTMWHSDDASTATPHLLHIFPSFAQGGVPIIFSALINYLGGSTRHTIISLDGHIECESRVRSDCIVDFGIPSFAIRNPSKKLRNISACLRKERPDILLTHNWGSIEWAFVNAFKRFSPHLHFESGFNSEEAEHTLRRRDIARRLVLRQADRVVVPSRSLYRLVIGKWGLDPHNVIYIPNGVDCIRYSALPHPEAIPGFTKTSDEVIIGTVAPLRSIKNIAKLIRVFANAEWHSETRLLIVGDGIERPRLVRLAADLGVTDRVFFAGHVNRPEMVLGLIDIFALTSDSEQMPTSILQAMAAGRAIVSTDVGDVAEMVAPANREFVVAKNDEAAFFRALFVLSRNPQLRAQLGVLNKARAESVFPEEKMLCSHRQLLGLFVPVQSEDR